MRATVSVVPAVSVPTTDTPLADVTQVWSFVDAWLATVLAALRVVDV